MADLKWADVAHYYLKSGITMQNVGKPSEYHKSWVAKDIMDLVLLDRGDIQLMPVLRHLEDMTEGEARELYTASYGKPWVEGKDTCAAYFRYKWKAYRTSLVGDYCNPKGIHWLISKGFDVFGLIESGQAIRKMESQPAEAQQQIHD